VVGASADVQSMEVVTMGPGAASALQSATTASQTEGSEDGVAEGEQEADKKKPIEAVVRIEYTITAHMQVSDSGETAVPASQESADLTLVWTPQGWRVSEVR
jgi:GTP cyclohydrolase III